MLTMILKRGRQRIANREVYGEEIHVEEPIRTLASPKCLDYNGAPDIFQIIILLYFSFFFGGGGLTNLVTYLSSLNPCRRI